VKRLNVRKLSLTAKAVLGYGEISDYLKGKRGLEETEELLKMNTRRFAKRQLTWFRADGRVRWFDASRIGERDIIGQISRVTGNG
jgi:tRNA dimethylallyltransferase